MLARRFPDLLSSLLSHLLRHAHHHQPRLQADLCPNEHRQIQALMHSFGADLLQIEPVALLVKKGRIVAWARQEEPADSSLLLEPLQPEIALIRDREGSHWNAFVAQRRTLVSQPSVAQQRSLQAPLLEIPAHMQFDGRFRVLLVPSATAPLLLELIGQRDLRTVLDDDRLEALHPRDAQRVVTKR